MPIHVLANELPDGEETVFTSPIPWATTQVTPTINGLLRTIGYTVIDKNTIEFDEPPDEGDVIGFFVTSTLS